MAADVAPWRRLAGDLRQPNALHPPCVTDMPAGAAYLQGQAALGLLQPRGGQQQRQQRVSARLRLTAVHTAARHQRTKKKENKPLRLSLIRLTCLANPAARTGLALLNAANANTRDSCNASWASKNAKTCLLHLPLFYATMWLTRRRVSQKECLLGSSQSHERSKTGGGLKDGVELGPEATDVWLGKQKNLPNLWGHFFEGWGRMKKCSSLIGLLCV